MNQPSILTIISLVCGGVASLIILLYKITSIKKNSLIANGSKLLVAISIILLAVAVLSISNREQYSSQPVCAPQYSQVNTQTGKCPKGWKVDDSPGAKHCVAFFKKVREHGEIMNKKCCDEKNVCRGEDNPPANSIPKCPSECPVYKSNAANPHSSEDKEYGCCSSVLPTPTPTPLPPTDKCRKDMCREDGDCESGICKIWQNKGVDGCYTCQLPR